MPLFSDHLSNMYYSGSPYSSAPYSYSSSVNPYGSFSASYLNPGGNYSSHSSIAGYSRTPLTSRWIMNGGRSYSPMLSTISEKGSHSPVRINSPRRTPLSSRSYIPSSYTPRPININTADIDVSRDRYRSKQADSGLNSVSSSYVPLRRKSPQSQKDSSPGVPEVVDKPNIGIDTSPGPVRSTIKRDRTVVRLHTIKRKDRDSPRKPAEVSDLENKNLINEDDKPLKTIKWREKLASDLAYNVKKDKKTLGAKLVEKFQLKDVANKSSVEKSSLSASVVDESISDSNKNNFGRRCSMELLAEQASLLDSLIQNENLSTTPLDMSKIGIGTAENVENVTNIKKRKLSGKQNELATTKSDHSLHNRALRENDQLINENRQLLRRKSLKKSLSGGSICKLDCISELPKIEMSVKIHGTEENKTKLKPKITSSVEVSDPPSPIKFFVENVTVEEIPKQQKKDIIFTSSIDNDISISSSENCPRATPEHRKSIKSKTKSKIQTKTQNDSLSADSDGDDNFWDKIGKRETVYLTQRKEKLVKEKNQRLLNWFPEEEDEYALEESKSLNSMVEDKFELKEEQENEISQIVIDEQNIRQKLEEIKETTRENKINPETTRENKINPDISEIYNAEYSLSLDALENIIGDVHLKESTTQIEVQNIDDENNKLIQNVDQSILDTSITDALNTSNKTLEDKYVMKHGQSEIELTQEVNKIEIITEIQPKTNSVQNIERKTKSKKRDAKAGLSLKKRKAKTLSKEKVDAVETSQKIVVKDICDKCKKEINAIKEADALTSPNSEASNSINLKNYDVSVNENQTNLQHNQGLKTHSLGRLSDENKQNEALISTTDENKNIIESTEDSNNGVPLKNYEIVNDISEDKLSTVDMSSKSNDASKKIVEKFDTNIVENVPKKLIKKEEKTPLLLIATPRPLQKKAPQIIHSSSSSESSEDESSEDSDDESDSSSNSAEFFECENNLDGRTSTGSSDSGFDSSVPSSPAAFLYVKKGGDNPSTSGSAPTQTYTHDILQKELENSTAYDLFRKTGRFTPPARSIPRFRKYTIEDFQFIKVLGKGSFGKVMLAELRETEYYYAVKCLKKDVVLEDDDVECTLIERKVLALGTNHPYLCHLFVTFQTDSHLFFVMEYLNGGDLMFHIQQSGRFPEVRARLYAAEIVSGLKFLHKRGIVYRDLKLDNILLDFDGHVRIADFGMCKLQIYLDKTADTFCGTPDYMAPEIIKGLKYNQTVDWWSFGVLLYEMLIGQSPFSGCDEDELFWSICNEMPAYPRFLSQESHTILTRLLDKDARTRLGGVECMWGDIRDQDFFRPIHWDKLERRELEAPFKPRVRHPMDTQYFDRAFTGERPRLTAIEPQVLRSMDQEAFRGFSYTNPNATDR